MSRIVIVLLCTTASYGCRSGVSADRGPDDMTVTGLTEERPRTQVEADSLECPRIGLTDGDGSRPPSLTAEAASHPPALSLEPFLRGAGIPVDSESLAQDVYLHFDQSYRLDGTCGRVAAWFELESRGAEAFVRMDGETQSLTLVDSLGRPANASSDRLAAVESGPVEFEEAGPSLVVEGERFALSEIISYGRWYARPPGVRYDDSDLVLAHTCDPYSKTDGFCGLESDGERPLADPPSPLVTLIGVHRSGGGQLVLTPIKGEIHTGLADFPGALLWEADQIVLDPTR